MLVALAVVTIAMAVVTTVFSITARTASQANAVADVSGRLRDFLYNMEEDLDYVDPRESVLVFVGRSLPAGLIEDDLDARRYWRVLTGDPAKVPANYNPKTNKNCDPLQHQYSNPRADLMMFFTNRPTASQAPPTLPPTPNTIGEDAVAGAKFSPVQVVYGHAAFDTPTLISRTPVPTHGFAGQLRHIDDLLPDNTGRSRLPCSKWHLGRRQTILDTRGLSPGVVAGDVRLSDPAFDRITRCQPGSEYGWQMPGDAARFNLRGYLSLFGPYTPSGRTTPIGLALARPYDFPSGPGWSLGGLVDGSRLINEVLYRNATAASKHHIATVIEQPPADLRGNLGLQLLPGCAWFQVEFLMPEDPRNSRDHPDPTQRDDMLRWTEIEPGKTYVFVPDSDANRSLVADAYRRGDFSTLKRASGGGRFDFAQLYPPGPPTSGQDTIQNRVIRMWPYAIRVTVRVIDEKGRLDEPIVRSLVHWFD